MHSSRISIKGFMSLEVLKLQYFHIRTYGCSVNDENGIYEPSLDLSQDNLCPLYIYDLGKVMNSLCPSKSTYSNFVKNEFVFVATAITFQILFKGKGSGSILILSQNKNFKGISDTTCMYVFRAWYCDFVLANHCVCMLERDHFSNSAFKYFSVNWSISNHTKCLHI